MPVSYTHLDVYKRQAENCVYNEECICHASGVEISGDRAEFREETSCATFCCDNKI